MKLKHEQIKIFQKVSCTIYLLIRFISEKLHIKIKFIRANMMLFEEVQILLYENKVYKTCGTKCFSNSLLAGLIFDDKNNLMTPSHSNSYKR